MSYIVDRKENRANRQNPVARIKWYCAKKTVVRSQKSEAVLPLRGAKRRSNLKMR